MLLFSTTGILQIVLRFHGPKRTTLVKESHLDTGNFLFKSPPQFEFYVHSMKLSLRKDQNDMMNFLSLQYHGQFKIFKKHHKSENPDVLVFSYNIGIVPKRF